MARIMGDHGDDSLWSRLERGEIPLDEFIAAVEREVPGAAAAFHPESPFATLARLQVRGDMVERVARFRAAGVPVALLTNNVAEWRPLWTAMLGDAISLFDAVVDSSAVGMRKPEERIFHHTLGLLGAEASTTVFVDDMELNVNGARAAGLHAVLATEDDAHLAVLDALLP